MLTVQNLSHDPFYNQAFEEFVFQTFRDDDVFLLWQNSPAVIVGSFQNICREVHVETLRKLGIPVVRRMSGGGTVYHDLGNVNYTYITRQNGPLDYDLCLGPVIEALNDIGVPARKNRTCDIAIGEKKISGSAQRSAGGRRRSRPAFERPASESGGLCQYLPDLCGGPGRRTDGLAPVNRSGFPDTSKTPASSAEKG